jgi:hypothetical protein
VGALIPERAVESAPPGAAEQAAAPDRARAPRYARQRARRVSGCSAVMDLRPTTSGGGLYGGDACLSMMDLINLAKQEHE